MKVYIHPALNPYYSSFYLYGLEQIFGRRNICYSRRIFGDMPKSIDIVTLVFIIEDDNHQLTKYVIDSYDFSSIREDLYDWCDVYGHCNVNYSHYTKDYLKLVPLCPSFGIRYWGLFKTLFHLVDNLVKLNFSPPVSFKHFVGSYIKQLRRLPYSVYEEKFEMSDNYIYHCSTLWYNRDGVNNDDAVNKMRTIFIDACRSISNLVFEGGLVVRSTTSEKQVRKFKDYITPMVRPIEYLQKTKSSMVVFNTPAFLNCHGWKLGEYMALGKCIITTPLCNELPPQYLIIR